MRIYRMSATFGKLEHETLTLAPGLNIIPAPNEWGKSTWCAFLVTMLYGLDTRAKTTKTALADKERYLPWSGTPMAGRIDLNWNGRDITLERRTKGRTVLGEFRAYETESGLDVPELTAGNCGQQLLGVEKNVFLRAGFLRFSDLPVTQDDALRRRLNALVTTGDESGAGDALAQKLKDLKNKCRHNKTGLLPQAEAEAAALESAWGELQELRVQSQSLQQRLSADEQRRQALENHRDHLRYQDAQADLRRVETAEADCARAEERLQQQQTLCARLPQRQEAERKRQAAEALQDRWLAFRMENPPLPPQPVQPPVPAHYAAGDAVARAREDRIRERALEAGKKKWNRRINCLFLPLMLLLLVGTAVGAVLLPEYRLAVTLTGGAAVVALGVAVLGISYRRANKFRTEMDMLYDRHPGLSPDKWTADAEEFAREQAAWQQALAQWENALRERQAEQTALETEIAAVTGGAELSTCLNRCNQVIAAWDALGDARREVLRCENHLQTLREMARTAPTPETPDTLTCTGEETARLLSEVAAEQRQLQLRLGQIQGRMESLGEEQKLQEKLAEVHRRMEKLERTYAALELAQTALAQASAALQRRFAPKIAARARELFTRLTGDRYDRLLLEEDLSLRAAARGEDTLRGASWRSDGTVDQLYLALRLAVAGELTPEAPLILDDALVRFDDERLKTALEILREESAGKQVILFTCQSRETQYQPEL